MFENIALAFQGIWSHKLRSLLTMLGIIIGIASIITIVSTIKGTNEQIKENLIGSGSNVVTVRLTQDGHELDMEYMPVPKGVTPLKTEDKETLEKLEGVEEVSFYQMRNYASNIYYVNTAFNGRVYGIDDEYFSVNDYRINYGRGFLERDYEKRRKVVIVDDKVAKLLFQGENPIGESMEINGQPFTVVGVVSKTQTTAPVINSVEDYWMYADTSAGAIFMPDACWPIVYRYDEPQNVDVRATTTDDMTVAGNGVAEKINELRVKSENCAYQANDLLEQAADIQKLSTAANQQLIWIAAISLLVGGIGVMNIMMVSVTERTREIGLKKAIGARRRRILMQFLTEAAVLTSLGGLFGVVGGIGLAKILSVVMEMPAAISVPACLVAVGFSMIIGIVFGLMPAVKASNLNPIEALRRE